jgi:hypothetical protein
MTCSDLAAALQSKPMAGWRCSPADDFLRLESPLRFADGGVIELYVEPRDGRFIVTDFGEAFRYLQTHGLDPLRSSVRAHFIALALSLGGATDDEGTIEIIVDEPGDILAAAVRLGQIMTRIADLSISAKGVAGGTFSEVVEEFLKTGLRGAEVRHGGTVQGRATTHQIDFLVHSTNGTSAVEALSAVTANGANAQTAYTIQKFADIAAVGAGAPRRFAVLDDAGEVWTEALRRQLENFAVVVDWERRDVLLQSL